MTEKVWVRASFRQVVTYTKTVEMPYSRYLTLGEQLDVRRGREYDNTVQDLFTEMRIDVNSDVSDSNDPELDDFEQVESPDNGGCSGEG